MYAAREPAFACEDITTPGVEMPSGLFETSSWPVSVAVGVAAMTFCTNALPMCSVKKAIASR